MESNTYWDIWKVRPISVYTTKGLTDTKWEVLQTRALTDPNAGKSETAYIFLKCGALISWKSTKQMVTATSTNHAELLAFHETARECV